MSSLGAFQELLKGWLLSVYFENKTTYQNTVESVVNYIIDTELPKYRGLETGNTRRVKALLKVLSQMVPYEVDITKLSTTIGIQRPTKTFFCNQLHSADHRVEYGGMKSGDFRIDGDLIIEVGGHNKTLRQVKEEAQGYVAADDIDSATYHKIPLWAFGFLY